MSLIIDLKPEIEASLAAKARDCGLSPEQYAEKVLKDQVTNIDQSPYASGIKGKKNFIEVFEPLWGLGVEIDVKRDKSPGRPVNL